MNTRNSEFSLIRRYQGLTFRQALYQFPNTKTAILNEDGDIVAANPLWVSELSESVFQLGANYFDICRLSLAREDAHLLITGMKRVIIGAEATYLSPYQSANNQSDPANRFRLFACAISDTPNCTLVAWEAAQATHQVPHSYRDVIPPSYRAAREFA